MVSHRVELLPIQSLQSTRPEKVLHERRLKVTGYVFQSERSCVQGTGNAAQTLSTGSPIVAAQSSIANYGIYLDKHVSIRHIWRMRSIAELAEHLRTERTRKGLSQAEMARIAGIPFRTYQRLEAGDPGSRLSAFLRACAALGLGLETTSARRPTLDELDTVYGHES
jgi:HTH-type transcriptional regulator / antitoxin HipB